MLKSLKSLIPAAWKHSLREHFGERTYAGRSYSQEGEDLVLQRLFESSPAGVFVDVGAHHPFRFSNTFLLYRRGWRGINIDARPDAMAAFHRHRPRDVSLELGVSAEPGRLQFSVFEEPALNTFDPALAQQRRDAGWPMQGTRWVECQPLAAILDRELPTLGVQDIDLLSVDVEGLDLEVLRSNEWSRYRPLAVVAEVLGTDITDMLESDVARFMDSVGYRPYAKLVNSAVFVRRNAPSAAPT
ncbi:MAG: FkbM family methyltransferase [Burkholderiaceae bacterium]|nr:FkbM family methyltransferase [Burkholderiaceae bacterium]